MLWVTTKAGLSGRMYHHHSKPTPVNLFYSEFGADRSRVAHNLERSTTDTSTRGGLFDIICVTRRRLVDAVKLCIRLILWATGNGICII